MDFNFSDGPYSGASTPRDEYPALYGYSDAAEIMWGLPDSQLLLGLNGEGDPLTVDLAADSPHILISAASGAGKSVTARAIATQALVKGATVVFLDAKRHSHRWAKALPGVHYASTMPEIANALISVAGEMHRRNEIIEQWPGSIETATVGPRLVVVFEEMNATMSALAALDKQVGKEDYTATAAFGDIMFLGRAALVNVIAIAQHANAKVLKTEWRENFGYRILIKHSWEMWNMLVPRANRSGGAPKAPSAVGRGYVVNGGEARQSQFLYMEEELCAALVRQYRGPVEELKPREDRKRRRAAIGATVRATGANV